MQPTAPAPVDIERITRAVQQQLAAHQHHNPNAGDLSPEQRKQKRARNKRARAARKVARR